MLHTFCYKHDVTKKRFYYEHKNHEKINLPTK